MKRKLYNSQGNISGILKYSDEDHSFLSKLIIYKNMFGYASTKIAGKIHLVHRLIMKPKPSLIVDHINHDRLDCRRENLRIVTSKQNAQNTGKLDNKSSIYKGVSWENGKYRSSITVNKKKIHLGSYYNEISAANAYDNFIHQHNSENEEKILHGLNFPGNGLATKKLKNERKFIGIRKLGNIFKVQISLNGKTKYIGSAKTELEAAKMYDDYITKNNLNKRPNFCDSYFQEENLVKTFCSKTNDENVVCLNIENTSIGNILINIDDYEKIKVYRWNIKKTKTGNEYLCCSKTKVLLHRMLMNAKDGDIIDHINGNGLDNRKCNLRFSDLKKNAQNRKKRENTSSPYVGVTKSRNRWRASVYKDNVCYSVGTFASSEEAAKARDQYIITNFPDQHYKLNF